MTQVRYPLLQFQNLYISPQFACLSVGPFNLVGVYIFWNSPEQDLSANSKEQGTLDTKKPLAYIDRKWHNTTFHLDTWNDDWLMTGSHVLAVPSINQSPTSTIIPWHTLIYMQLFPRPIRWNVALYHYLSTHAICIFISSTYSTLFTYKCGILLDIHSS